nr:hypothetical protein [Tanacetum cinerariifolium]
MQTNQFAGAVSSILEIVQRYMDQRMNEAVKVAVQIQSDRLCDEAQAENDELGTSNWRLKFLLGHPTPRRHPMSLLLISQRWSLRRFLSRKWKAIRKEPGSASAPKEKATKSAGKSTQGSKSQQMLASESATAEEPMQTTPEMEEPSHLELETSADDQPIVEPS